MFNQFLFLGLGSIGMRHIQNLVRLRPDVSIAGYDPSEEQSKTACLKIPSLKLIAASEADLKKFLKENASQYLAVFICTPSAYHAVQLEQLIEFGWRNIFVEKPLCMSASELRSIGTLVDRNHVKLMVGCNFRYDTGLMFLKRQLESGVPISRVASVHAEFGYHLPEWRPGRNYKENYSALKRLGGGVLFDRIHELDYISYLFGTIREISGFTAKNSSLAIDVEDTAEIICRFDNGILGHIHVDYLSPFYVCRMKLVGEDGVLEWNFDHSQVIFRKGKEGISEKLFEEKTHDVNMMYTRELADFLDFISSNNRSYDEFFLSAAHVTEKLLEVKESNVMTGAHYGNHANPS